MKADTSCQLLCEAEVPADGINFISNRIRENYRMNWLIDGLAAAQKTENNLDLSLGFPLGYVENDKVHLNNHYDIELHYHTVNEKYYRVSSDITWATRWDNYLAIKDSNIHWLRYYI
ncbi:Transmembrane 9 superfamily protein [Smittium culicis]|uniref:Transmembrane 9 superfamily member n=1 Tax=Smittium culicis TaxID=133412 RepID=A0A1R1XMV7_9FUNG|nr:Transmembrane 9 superfamily protein [Smittium culicis]